MPKKKNREVDPLLAAVGLKQGYTQEEADDSPKKSHLDAMIPYEMRGSTFHTRTGWMSAFIKYCFTNDAGKCLGADWKYFRRERFMKVCAHIRKWAVDELCPFARLRSIEKSESGYDYTTLWKEMKKLEKKLSPFWAALVFLDMTVFKRNLPPAINWSGGEKSPMFSRPASVIKSRWQVYNGAYLRRLPWLNDSLQHYLVWPDKNEIFEIAQDYRFNLEIKLTDRKEYISRPELETIGGWAIKELAENHTIPLEIPMNGTTLEFDPQIIENLYLNIPSSALSSLRQVGEYKVEDQPMTFIRDSRNLEATVAGILHLSQYEDSIQCVDGSRFEYTLNNFQETFDFQNLENVLYGGDSLLLYNINQIPWNHGGLINSVLAQRFQKELPTAVCGWSFSLADPFPCIHDLVHSVPQRSYRDFVL